MKFADESVQKILDYANKNDIPNILDKKDFHTTLIYSRKHLPKFVPMGDLEHPLVGFPMKFDIWPSPPNAFKKEETHCLILLYKCQEQEDRFDEIMTEHDAMYDYDEYNTHVTFSYDVGPNFTLDNLDASLVGELSLVKEYSEDLDLDKTFN